MTILSGFLLAACSNKPCGKCVNINNEVIITTLYDTMGTTIGEYSFDLCMDGSTMPIITTSNPDSSILNGSSTPVNDALLTTTRRSCESWGHSWVKY